jgi:2-polyprenyl-3-methyl-5-hydroxy-6-metoxy-1,4-benzoquinol methylase
MANKYLSERDKLKTAKYLQQLIKYLPKNAKILDLGCGAGVPVDDILIKAGHEVTGLDISKEQVKLARKNCPRGDYAVVDIAELSMNEYQMDSVVCFYTLFHLPRTEHKKLLTIMQSFLQKNGMLLVTMGDREFEGRHVMHGEEMWSSQYGTAKNVQLVKDVGFEIIMDEIDRSGGERHQIILARKI